MSFLLFSSLTFLALQPTSTVDGETLCRGPDDHRVCHHQRPTHAAQQQQAVARDGVTFFIFFCRRFTIGEKGKIGERV